MFWNIAQFFITNSKLTFVLVVVTFIVWIWSYFSLPKQFNPTIIVPAFQIEIPSHWLDAEQVKNLIISPVENLIMELDGIDEVYGYSYDNYAGLMAKFHVWIDAEDAKIRLIQKINENLNLKPWEIGTPKITSIDPEELSQITYAIYYIPGENDPLSQKESQIYLRQIAHLIKEEVKILPNITTMEIVGWLKKDIIIELDLDSIQAKNTDILEIYEQLKKYQINTPSGEIVHQNERIFVWIESKVHTLDEVKNLVISQRSGTPLYLWDVANITYASNRINSFINYSDGKKSYEAVLLGFWKKKWSNAVITTKNIEKTIENFSKNLPKDIKLEIIQNEWETAKKATNMLLINLFQSFIIVFLVLALYLWVKDAFNTAVSIPLSLALVFFIAVLIWDNINKITLFALILVLWMIVDNSTVVVENISRHLEERIHTGKSKIEAIILWVQEVWFWVIMATLTRLLAFWSMFAVGGMMWEYMGPIPKYAIFALLVSLVISLTINPWLSFLWAKDIQSCEEKNNKKIPKIKFDPRKYYLSFMEKFLLETPQSHKKRKRFKMFFWLSLFVIILAPIYLWIFKARMLPKSDQNQIYVWIDAQRSTSAQEMKKIEQDMSNFFLKNETLPANLKIVENISSSIGQAFMWDFANLFRGGSQRISENQISSRINLIDGNEYKKEFWEKRITSEAYTIKIRDIFKDYMLSRHPDIEVRLVEDPPGPPVESTFRVKIKSNASDENKNDFFLHTYQNIEKIANKYSLVDLWDTQESTFRKISIKINHTNAINSGISPSQISATLGILYSNSEISMIQTPESFEHTSLILGVKNAQTSSIENLKNIVFTNQLWQKIPLESLAQIEYGFVSPVILTDKREQMQAIYAEMWDNSLVYPVISLFKIFLSDDFIQDKYKIISWNPYKIEYEWIQDWKKYIIEWGWEWELTVDTFRDLWIAMMISLLAIYFLLVGQFASFGIAGIIMITFLLSFFWVFPIFTFLYILNNEYFSATSMIGIIALGWIVVWNAIILIDYLNILQKNGLTLKDALLKAWYVRFAPIILTSLTTVFWAATIVWDPVWSGLAWAIIWWLFVSSILTLIVIPIFYYESQKKYWK